jgi:RNA polymerase sigma factor (sigma-70 family)
VAKKWTDCLVRAKAGDLASFNTVVREFQDMAVGYAYSVLGDFHLAEDAAQEAFVEAYYGLRGLKEPSAFPAWLRKIVSRRCSRLLRNRKLPSVPLEGAVELRDPALGPLEAAAEGEARDRVLAAVDALPEEERTVCALFCIDGYSLAEVGDFLEVPVSTVKNRLHSARRQLRERMASMVEDTLKQHAPGEEFGKRVARVLDGIERIHWKTTGSLCFTGSVLACMRFMGEPVTSDYIMGISGGAFKLFWHPEWSPANCDLLLYGEEPVRRTFNALGYRYTYMPDYHRDQPKRTREFYRKQIVESIDQRRPVLAFGIVGPPECCVIAGYDREGEVVYGRSYFQGHPLEERPCDEEPSGYFRSDEWYDNFSGMIRICEKAKTPTPQKVMQQTLEWAIRLAREPEFDSPHFVSGEGEDFTTTRHLSGLAAYDEIIAAVGRDADFPRDDADVLMLRCMVLGNDGIHLLCCKRHSAREFLMSMAEKDIPGAAQLRKAAECYGRECEGLSPGYRIVPGFHKPPAVRQRIADPALRRQIADMMREAKSHEEQAVRHLEQAYAAVTKKP